MNNLFIHKILEQAELYPENIALQIGSTKLTYKELKNKILTTATYFSKLPEKSRILFMLQPDFNGISTILGILVAGHSVVIVEPFVNDVLFTNRIQAAKTTHYIASPLLEKISKINKKIHFTKTLLKKETADLTNPNKYVNANPRLNVKSLYKEQVQLENFNINPNDPALLVFTSGTTDNPKGIVQTHQTLSVGLEETREKFNITPGKKIYSEPMTLGLVALSSGATWILQKDIDDDHAQLEEADIWFGTPYDATKLLDNLVKNKHSFETIGIGAGPVTKKLVEKIDQHFTVDNILCVYGMTEILPISIGDAREKNQYNNGDYVGKTLKHVKVEMFRGEIHIQSNGVAKYFTNKNDEWLPTGDYGFMQENKIFLQSRKKDMYIRGDMNIYPSLYESNISTIAGIEEAYIVGIPDELGDDFIVLVVKEDGKIPTSQVHQNLLDELEQKMEYKALPDEIVFIKDIPVSGRANKVNREKLIEIAKDILFNA